jgi:recombination protein RecT
MGAITQTLDTTASAPAKVTFTGTLRELMDRFRPVVTDLLRGTGVDEPTFRANIGNAVRSVPELAGCTPETVLGSALKCAQLGLVPNDPRNQAWILPYKGKASFQLGYGGVIELARRAVPGLIFDGRAVYPGDEFDVDFGRTQPLLHRPGIVRGHTRNDDEQAFAWYVQARYPDGSVQLGLLDRTGVEYHRSFSKQPNGMLWTKSYDAAALKSVVMDMRRWLPTSTQLAAAYVADDQVHDVNTVEPIEATYATGSDETAAGELEDGGDTDA